VEDGDRADELSHRGGEAFYSVPYTYAGQKVDVRISASCVEIFKDNIRICSHPRSFGNPYGYITNTDHMPPHHKKYWSGRRTVPRLVGEDRPCHTRCRAGNTGLPQGGAAGLPLLLWAAELAERFSAVRLEAACARAIELKSSSYTTVSSMLKNGMDRPKYQPSSRLLPDHENIRGPEYYAQKGGELNVE